MAMLTGCMAVADTANIYSQEELDSLALVENESAQEEQPEVIDITPCPTASTTPYKVHTAVQAATPSPDKPSPTPEITPSPTQSASAEPSPSPTHEYKIDEYSEYKAGYINAGSANMRKGPGTKYDIIRELGRNTKITITGESGDWYRIKIDDDRGYVLKQFAEFGSPATATPKPQSTATAKPTSTPTQTQKPSGDGSFSDANGFTADELMLIAQVVHREANGSSIEAQAAVANVIYNRIKSSGFPDTVKGVIFQKYQFSVANDSIYSVTPSATAVAAVKQIFVNGDMLLPDNVLYFRSSSKGTSWSAFTYYATYGGNSFFYK